MTRRKLLLYLLLAALVALGAGCAGPRPGGLKPAIHRDTIERGPVGLNLVVTKFQWRYVRGGGGLEVTARVRNTTRRAQAPVWVYAMLFDEGGRAVGMGDARVMPPSLAPGQEGTFTLVAATSRPQRPRPIKYLRLLTNFQNS